MFYPHTELRTVIRRMINITPEANELLNPNIQAHMANSLADFCYHAVTKFIAGQKEHGGKITDRDLNLEIYKELIDIMWYHWAKGWDDSRLGGIESKHNPERKEHV